MYDTDKYAHFFTLFSAFLCKDKEAVQLYFFTEGILLFQTTTQLVLKGEWLVAQSNTVWAKIVLGARRKKKGNDSKKKSKAILVLKKKGEKKFQQMRKEVFASLYCIC